MSSWCLRRPFLIPILLVLICFLSIIILAYAALGNRLIYTTPFIFDFGRAGYPSKEVNPRIVSTWEKYGYVMLINVVAILLFFIVYIRYRKVRFLCENVEFQEKICTYGLNTLNVCLGCSIVILLPIIGILSGNDWAIKNLGLFACALLLAYELVDILLSVKIYPAFGSSWYTISKLVVFICTIGICGLYFIYLSRTQYPPFLDQQNSVIYTPDIRGYRERIKAVIFSWILAAAIFIYFALLTIVDFYDIQFEDPPFVVNYGNEDECCDKK